MVKVREEHALTPEGELDEKAWLERTVVLRDEAALQVIQKALALGQLPEAEGLTEAGEECFEQSLQMAEIIASLNMDASTIAATLVYCGVEFSGLSLDSVKEVLGSQVRDLVAGTQKMRALSTYSGSPAAAGQDGAQLDKLRKMLLAMASDVRVVLVKLAEHLCHLRVVKAASEEERRRVAKQSQDLFAPLANRLGVGQIKWELEDLAFRYLEPGTYKRIAKLLDERRVDRERYIKRVIQSLDEALKQEGVEAEVHGRVKHIFSIWRKMSRKNLDYEEIYDVRAVRILVPTIQACYSALGTVHSLWKHIHKEFDDYIATPKENGYQSLHTAVIGPEGKTLEVQIRTHQMHQDSELGVAAHWRYKEGGKRDESYEAQLAWLRQLLDWQDEVSDASALMDELKTKVVEERVYVLTPKGDVLDLALGSTPLDFAYSVHTAIGHRCRGAKVNGRIVPLTYKIKTGEKIEIITGPVENPSRDWLNVNSGYLHSSRARSKVQQWFKHQNKDQNILEGRALLERELQRLDIQNIALQTVAKKLNYSSPEDVLASFGTGDLRLQQILNAADVHVPSQDPKVYIPTERTIGRSLRKPNDIMIEGVGNLVSQIAQCCKPLPGDPIVGYITQGRGVTIHREDCRNLETMPEERAERLVDVEWGGSEKTYPVDIEVTAYDRPNILRDITACLANEHVNLSSLHSSVEREKGCVFVSLRAEVVDLDRLARLLDKLQQLPNVMTVRRQS